MSHHGYFRGAFEAMLDEMENVPFGSVGGLGVRVAGEFTYPDYIPVPDRPAWLCGYLDWCRRNYGEDWRTCQFGWVPVLKIGKDGVRAVTETT